MCDTTALQRLINRAAANVGTVGFKHPAQTELDALVSDLATARSEQDQAQADLAALKEKHDRMVTSNYTTS